MKSSTPSVFGRARPEDAISTRRILRVARVAAALVPLFAVACGSAETTTAGDGAGGHASVGPDAGSSAGTGDPGAGTGGGGDTGGSSGGSTGGGSSGGGSSGGSSSGGLGGGGDGGACAAKGSEVVMIGDSYPALSGEIAKQLQKLARTAGTLGASDAYRTYYVSGTQMVGGMSPNIPAQYGKAVAADKDIKFVIMDGGGNDILIGNNACITSQPPPANPSCVKTVDDAVSAATQLFARMKSDGVEKVIYFFYPHLPTNGKPYVNDTLDYAAPKVKAACDAAPIPCYFIDPRAAFDGHAEYIGPDGIHPTTAGSDVLAGLIWDEMKKECIAQ